MSYYFLGEKNLSKEDVAIKQLDKSSLLRTIDGELKNPDCPSEIMKLPLVVLDRFSNPEDWEWEVRLIILFVEEGKLALEVDGNMRVLPPSSVLYLNPYESLNVLDDKDCIYRLIPFNPYIINKALLFRNLIDGELQVQSGFRDFFYITPFFYGIDEKYLKLDFSHSRYLGTLIDELEGILKDKASHKWPYEAKAVLIQILYKVEGYFARAKESSRERESDPDAPGLVEKICSYMKDSYHRQITLDHLCEQFAINRTTMNDLFKKTLDVTVMDYLINIRMEEARKMLINTRLNMSEICDRTGYTDPSYFSRTFRNRVGVSPSLYRKENTKGSGRL
ncbi:MAG: AraC family transcriptional regulator [Spirochaetales bacterium]|nr:AraC family transcriptional regulator [Spirochaetales bacterium]